MITAKHKNLFAVSCIIFALIVYAIIACSLVSWIVYGVVVQDAFIIEGTTVYYSGEPIFKPWSIFLYLTTQNTFFTATVLLLLGIAVISKNEKFIQFMCKNTLWSYILVFYTLMNVTVFVFDAFTGFQAYIVEFEKFKVSYISIVSITSRFVLHHALWVYLILLFRHIQTTQVIKSAANKSWPCVIIFLYFIVWYLLINILGRFAFKPYEWYPYVAIIPFGFFKLVGIPVDNLLLTGIFYFIITILDVCISLLVYIFKRILNNRTIKYCKDKL